MYFYFFCSSGSWFDPSNPVLKRRDKPRSDLLERAEVIGRDTDLMLALGSSLSPSPGLFLPRLVASRGLEAKECLGLVIVGLQQSPLDHLATLRVFCDMDTFLKVLLDKLRIRVSFSLDMGRHIVHRAKARRMRRSEKLFRGRKRYGAPQTKKERCRVDTSLLSYFFYYLQNHAGSICSIICSD